MHGPRLLAGLITVALALLFGCDDEGDETNGSGGSAGAGGGVVDCSSLAEAACADHSDCTWLAAGCHEEVLFEGCFDEAYSPSPPPCAPLPCPDYATQAECTAQEACDWWPLDCPGHTITDQCRNIGFGNPASECQ